MEVLLIVIPILLIPILGLFFLIRFIRRSFNAPKVLIKKYKEMGDPIGKTYDSIEMTLGQPNSKTNSSDGTCEAIWHMGGSIAVQINLLFDENSICIDCQDTVRK